jgi:acyl-CoA thioester hydrolase
MNAARPANESNAEDEHMTDSEQADLLAGYPVIIELPVVWGEMDSYRHVNNAVYFRYFESARLEYFRRLGWFEFEEQTGVGPILAATSARFRRPLTYPDTIHVAARVSAVEEDRFTMQYRLVSRKLGAVAAEGTGTIVTYHYARGTKTPVPEELRRRISELEATSRNQDAVV